MSIQMSVAVRNARGNAVEVTIGPAPILEIRSGSPPVSCAAADSGTLLASITLPSDWMTDAASGVKSMSGTWQDPSANAAGTAGHFRLKDSGGSNCHMQGTITVTGGGGDMTIDNTSIASAQEVNVTSFTTTEPNA